MEREYDDVVPVRTRVCFFDVGGVHVRQAPLGAIWMDGGEWQAARQSGREEKGSDSQILRFSFSRGFNILLDIPDWASG